MGLSLEDSIENSEGFEKEEVQSPANTNFVDDGKVPNKSNPNLLTSPFDSTEMEDVKNHFMLIHREHFMYKCWECEDKMKTISELKTHYAKFHLHKLNEPHYYPPYNI